MAINDPFEELIDYLQATRAALHGAVVSTPPTLRERKPAPDTWSVAEVLEHLAIIEKRIARLLGEFVTKAREAGLNAGLVASSIVDSIDVPAIRNRSLKIVTREGGVPTGGLSADAALQELTTSRRDLLKVIEDVKRIDLTNALYPHPVFGPLNGYQWLAFVGAHEERHTDQINEIVATLSHSV